MATEPSMFLFEVVVEDVESYSSCRQYVIRSEFANIFSLDLKDPKQMNIVIPEPPPLPPEPPGKKKKKKKPKPKKKKGKKGAIELPPPEPIIQSGQSVLFTSSPELLTQNMTGFPMVVSFWSKEDGAELIGSVKIPWDQAFLTYLDRICKCEEPPPVTVHDHYNIFDEDTSKLMAKVGIQVKLTWLKQKATAAFRTLSEDLSIRKYLYTGLNSKTTSYMCTLKTTDEWYDEHCPKALSKFTRPLASKDNLPKITYADFKNAPSTNLPFTDPEECCIGKYDKPPDSIYKAPVICPSVDDIINYVRTIIVSCNDNMRMLTPRPTIRPRVKATDIDRFCYCKQANWPMSELADRFKREVQGGPCPLCINAPKKEGLNAIFNIANIRGPCGKPDCRIARDLRAYLEKLIEEDNTEINIDDVIGPCGSKTCLLAEKIQEFLRHEGAFSTGGATEEGLSTQCACIRKMQEELLKEKKECQEACDEDCEDNVDDKDEQCGGAGCPFVEKTQIQSEFTVLYFTVQYDFESDTPKSTATTPKSAPTTPKDSKVSIKAPVNQNISFPPDHAEGFPHCDRICPQASAGICSKDVCGSNILDMIKDKNQNVKCDVIVCPNTKFQDVSPNDSNVEIKLDDIHNYCCVKSCGVAEEIKDFIAHTSQLKTRTNKEDDCYCDCACSMNFMKKTTYCGVCGGYERLGDEMLKEPSFAVPYPCPVYHKLYDRNVIKTTNPWPDAKEDKKPPDTISVKSSKSAKVKNATAACAVNKSTRAAHEDKKLEKLIQKAAPKRKNKNSTEEPHDLLRPFKNDLRLKYPPMRKVPRNMGWLWDSESIPALKPRPKWRPGAVSKALVIKYRALREGSDSLAKKKRLMAMRKKKVEPKPTILIKKLHGEFTVQMEVFKKYSKDRLLYQNPYEDCQPLVYHIGRTEEENKKINIRKERRERRENRRKSKLIQSTFRDKCQEICLKAYNQAIGVLPLPNPNSPECPCQTRKDNDIPTPIIDSCSCSDIGSLSSSETDDDEWTIEFSPPAAKYNPKAKHLTLHSENETQYSYLDYKVKLFDKQNNPVPRYFKGPDGKEECSDLGGFWGPGHVWLEINRDGFIAQDGRWVPMTFTGPDGMFYSAEDGVFTDMHGKEYKIGVDGYIDKDSKWVSYAGRRPNTGKSTAVSPAKKGSPKDQAQQANQRFGNKSAQSATAAKSAVTTTNKPALKKPVIPVKNANTTTNNATVLGGKGKNVIAMRATNNNQMQKGAVKSPNQLKIDPKKLAMYRDIIKDYDMFGGLYEHRPMKTNRACNTTPCPQRQYSQYNFNRQYCDYRSSPMRCHPSGTNCPPSNCNFEVGYGY